MKKLTKLGSLFFGGKSSFEERRLRYFDQHRLVFVHIPKCGGKSVNNVLGLSGALHFPLAIYEQRIPSNDLDEMLVFALLRQPVERFISAYRYLAGRGNGSHDDVILSHFFTRLFPTIEHFIESPSFPDLVMTMLLFQPATSFVSSSAHAVQIFRLESDIPKLGLVLSGHLKRRVIIPHINRTPDVVPSVSLSTRQRLLVEAVYEKDMELYENTIRV